MSYKKASIISLIIFGIIGIYSYIVALSFPAPATGVVIGPAYYPKLLSALMIILSIVGLITNVKGEDKKIEFPNKKYFIFTLASMILFTVIWQFVGGFFVTAFIIMITMLFFFNQSKHIIRKLLYSMCLSFIVTIFVYIIFDKLLRVAL